MRRASRASGCSTPSSSSTPTTARRRSSLRSPSPAGDRGDQRVEAAARRRRASSAANAGGELRVLLEPQPRGQAVGGERAGDVRRAAPAPRVAAATSSGRARPSRRRGPARAPARGAGRPRRPTATSASASDGHEPVEEALDLRGRQRADELVDDLAVLERLDGRDRLDPERLRDARVGVGVDLDELDLPSRLSTAFSITGPSERHGPHHSAQKSTTTGCS